MTAALYWNAYRGMVVKQLRRVVRTWIQTLLPSVVTAALFLVVLGQLVGREIGTLGGVGYTEFLMPGLVMLAVVTNAYSNVTLAVFGAKLQRHIEELLVAPMPPWLIVAGFVTGGVLRGLLVGLLVAALALPLTGLQFHHPVGIAGMAVLAALLFSFAGLINGIYARTFDHTSVVTTFVLTPLIYLGGLFYPVSRLDEPWQSLSLANPMYYLIEGFRHGLLGTSAVPWWATFAMLGVATAIAGAVALTLVARGTRVKP
ncbi:ABC transporter permease [Aquisalimonas asiatica]|uniref:Transport permease protein n=1 Tax=Aquisalimonas asiatica TaxID=406100 RepID=A0A1H8U9V2_9GAMM|nr:ABC transporter permease [Aquisalimonas asiatica]SEO99817.1 ABC-2 type transport system permease protein [Aquisalimonas asiatica]